jgi:glucans biosynthesis protein
MRISRDCLSSPTHQPFSQLASRLLACIAILFICLPAARAFDLDAVSERARQLASQPYQAQTFKLPDDLKALSYDQYRDIRFKPDRAVWRKEKLPFELMFFHLGKFQKESIRVNEIDEHGQARHLGFDRNDFDYGHNTQLAPQNWGDVGYAGFRVHYAINNPAYKDEILVFMGASYFRAVGAGQHYGLSARGLAIDTVGANAEEFPRFSEFWIEKPKPDATSLVIYALMESPRATGAYRFVVHPGGDMVMDVESRLFLRSGATPIATLGVAPLTSMFLFGENQPNHDDFRPEVHDSDGLMVATGDGEWLWRPLINPRQTFTTSFAMKSLRGYGLMQRDRNFSSYEDTEDRYELRPSTWIAPRGDWGPGRVELVQIPTPDETNDNIVAYWVPDHLPAPGQPLNLAYQMRWQGQQQQHPPASWATQSRLGRGFDALAPNEKQYVIDFTGPALAALPLDAVLKAVVTAGANGQVTGQNVYRNEAAGTWRVNLRVKQIDRAQPVELRAFLQHGNDTVSETWTSVLPPQ